VKSLVTSFYSTAAFTTIGVIEFQWFLQCQFPSTVAAFRIDAKIYERFCNRPKPPTVEVVPQGALVLGIDSSLLRSEATPADIPTYRDWLTYVIPIRLYGTAASVDMIMFGSGEQRKSQLRRFIQQLNPPSPLPGYVPNDPQVLVVRRGPYQYINFDLEALSQFACPDKIERDGTYKGRPGGNTRA